MNIISIFGIVFWIFILLLLQRLHSSEQYSNLGTFVGYLINQNPNYDSADNSWKLFMRPEMTAWNTIYRYIFTMVPSNTNYNPRIIQWEPFMFDNYRMPFFLKDIPIQININHPYLHDTVYKFVKI